MSLQIPISLKYEDYMVSSSYLYLHSVNSAANFSPLFKAIEQINERTTIAQFRRYLARINPKPSCCKRDPFLVDCYPIYLSAVLGKATWVGNASLIEHIINAIRKENLLIEAFGPSFLTGRTPLFDAVLGRQNNIVENFLTMDSGKVSVNIAVSEALSLHPSYIISSYLKKPLLRIPEGITPLWVAIEHVNDLALVVILLKNGAIAEPALSMGGQQLLQQGQEKVVKDFDEMMNATIANVPKSLSKIIFEYLGQFPLPESIMQPNPAIVLRKEKANCLLM